MMPLVSLVPGRAGEEESKKKSASVGNGGTIRELFDTMDHRYVIRLTTACLFD